jgi:hypothetical protein
VKGSRTSSSLSNNIKGYVDSESLLSEADGYVVCGDCLGSSCSEIKTQMKDE